MPWTQVAIGVLCLLYGASAYMGPVMGELTPCDDAVTGISQDWDTKDYTPFTCPNENMEFAVQPDIESIYYELAAVNTSFDPRRDVVYHKCITEKIEYTDIPPIRGNHRPNWGRYGEYLYLPPQRWLHNLEHGTIVLLYHPCVSQNELGKLRKLVTSCLYRHIITPYNKLSADRPLALISWGVKLEMNMVVEKEVTNFIMLHAREGPEDLYKDGLYDHFLMIPAKIVTDQLDSIICPSAPRESQNATAPPNEKP